MLTNISHVFVHWDGYLNHWMVDYDIICTLKDYVGYSSWTDVPSKQRALCYRNYNKNVTLPEWDTEQERYWICEDKIYKVPSKDTENVKTDIQGTKCPSFWNIPNWNSLNTRCPRFWNIPIWNILSFLLVWWVPPLVCMSAWISNL